MTIADTPPVTAEDVPLPSKAGHQALFIHLLLSMIDDGPKRNEAGEIDFGTASLVVDAHTSFCRNIHLVLKLA